MDPASVRTVILAAGSSTRMGFDKLAAPLAGVPLIRRVAAALASLRPLVVAPAHLAELVAGLPVTVVLTAPTAGPAATLALADAAVPADLRLAVVLGDLVLIDAEAVGAILARVPEDADLAWPVVGGVPGHPTVWSPRARRRIAGLRGDEAPGAVRRAGGLRTVALSSDDRRYVTDVDTPAGWEAARRLVTRGAGRS